MTPPEWKAQLGRVRDRYLQAIPQAKNINELERLKVGCLGRKGALTELLKALKDFPMETRKPMGTAGNSLKNELTALIEERRNALVHSAMEGDLLKTHLDPTLPPFPFPDGRLHPLTLTMERMTDVLSKMGFSLAEGPMVETEYYNFGALNMPADHPARDLHDTFYLKDAGPPRTKKENDRLLMRTHASPVQIRHMQNVRPPLRIMSPGRCFRHDAVDASHSAVFYQLEGFYVDRHVSMADLKGTLQSFISGIFGPEAEIRFSPSYFPFVEPGTQVDMKCIFCQGSNLRCSVCKGTGWVEMLGAGIIHPDVFKAVNYDPEVWNGFAFGIGVDRVAMLLFGINDIRTFYENDLRVLEQFSQ